MKRLWIFDNDGTLYSAVKPFEDKVVQLMTVFLSQRLGVDVEKVQETRRSWLKKHETSSTLIAVMKEGIDAEEFLRHTYLAVDVFDFVQPNDKLREGLLSLSGMKVILTNNPKEHAERVTMALGIAELFDGIYGMKEMEYILKPDPMAFRPVLDLGGIVCQRVFVDDSPDNIAAAKRLGFETVLVGVKKPLGTTADRIIGTIEELFD